MRRLSLLLAAACLLAAKTPITHESMWMMKRVGAPVPSPDGKLVLFSVTQPSYDEKEQSSDLWLVPADGSAKPRQITFTKSAESSPSWSPDSRSIVFAAKREGDEASQVYLLDLSGGEARRITNLTLGASGPRVSPDSKWILFNSRVYPGAVDEEANKKAHADRKARKYTARVYESFPIRHWDKWLEDLQTHIFVQPLEAGAKAKDLLAGTKLVAEKGFGGVSTSSGEEFYATWAPDSRSVVFAASSNRNAAAYGNVFTHLFQAQVNGGDLRQLTSGTDASYARPQFRPDGKALYALHQREGEKIYSLSRLAMFSWPDVSRPTVVTGDWDRSVSSVAFTPDSRTIYLTAEDAGNEKVYAMDAAGGDVRTVVDLKLGCYSNLEIADRGATALFANWESAVNPIEIVRIDPQSKGHRLLTDFNVEKARDLDIKPLQHFWITAKNGKRIHSMIALPPNFDESKKYPLFVVIHGGPASMWRDQWVYRWNYHLLAAPGYVVLLTDYTGSTGYGEKFAQDIQGDPLKGPAEEINEAADAAIAKFPFIDGSRQAAGGASYGGHLANWLQATTTRYKCLISHAGLINLESQWGTSDTIFHRELASGGPVWEQGRVWREQNPIRFAKNFKTPILVTVGENDFRVPLNQSLENWSVLQRMKVPSKLVVFPDENHWILKAENSRFWFSEVHGWLKKYL